MKKNIEKLAATLLVTAIFTGCTTEIPASNTKKETKVTETTNDKVVTNQQIQMLLTAKKDGVENPIGPEDISSVVVGGVTIPASEIVIKSSPFATKAESNSEYQVVYEGAGKYNVVNQNTGKVLQNRALIVFNLLNAKSPAILPVLQGILENNIRMTMDFSTGNVYGGVSKEDGTIDDTKPVFKIGTDGKMTLTQPDGTQTVFSRNDANATNLPDPEKTVTLSAEEVKKQVGEISGEIKADSPIVSYIGLWLYEGLGQKIIFQLRDSGQNKFDASATVADKKYTGQGNYNPTGRNDTLTLKVAEDQMHIDVSPVGSNALTLTLKSTSSANLKTFQNVPVNLQRVRIAE